VATIHLPRSLVTLFPDPPPRHVEMDAASLHDVVELLDQRWPGMRDRLCVDGPAFREHINVFVDGQRERDLATSLTSGSVVHLIPAVAGG
jgi:molybdopterin converting factor small subunit